MAAAESKAALDLVPDVVIPDDGTFKFILVKVTDPDTGLAKTVVRG